MRGAECAATSCLPSWRSSAVSDARTFLSTMLRASISSAAALPTYISYKLMICSESPVPHNQNGHSVAVIMTPVISIKSVESDRCPLC